MAGVVEEAKAEIRFALNQLSARNGQYEFESLARTLARATVTRNVLPATGPVSAGGDQGRDFETYRTELPGQTRALGRELGMRDGDGVGFACTLQQIGIDAKIAEDVEKVLGDGTAVDFILIYCEVNIPIGHRHSLQRGFRTEHDVHVEIFDGNAIADLLADHATFWIAETYLHLPARALPPPPDRPGWYEDDLARWQATDEPVFTWGQYVDLTGCLRYAYNTREGRENIPFWLEKLEPLLGGDVGEHLRRATRHQVIIAHHLGLGTMRPVGEMVVAAITEATASSDANVISDAVVVLLLSCAALAHDETGHTAGQIMAWNRALTERVESLLDDDPRAGDACSLLESLAALRMQPDLDAAGDNYRIDGRTTDYTVSERMQAIAEAGLTPVGVPCIDGAGVVAAYARLAEILPSAPLYPVEHASRFLTLNTVLLVDEPDFERLANLFDERLAAADGDSVIADKALDRGSALLANGRTLDGLRHMHRARLNLFNGEAGPRLIHATLATASIYRKLGLHSAAKYYALVASVMCRQDDIDLVPRGLFEAAAADYHQGNWVSAVELNRIALTAHRELAPNPLDMEEYPWLGSSLFELTNIRALADHLGAPFKDFVDDAIAGTGVSPLLEMFLSTMRQGTPLWWETLDAEQHSAHIAARLGGPAFADAGPVREIRFQCLGVTWTVRFSNSVDDAAVAEGFTATLQIVLAHLAPADLALLPTNVTVAVAVGTAGAETTEQIPADPGETRFECTLALTSSREPETFAAASWQVFTAVIQVVLAVSTRSDEDFEALVAQACDDDLPSIAAFAMPFEVAFLDFTRHHTRQLDPLPSGAASAERSGPGVVTGLGFPDGPGTGYTVDHAREDVDFKYTSLPERMKPTLAALRREPAFAATVAVLREQGWLDWHILMAVHGVAKNARLNFRSTVSPDDPNAIRNLFLAPEPDNDPVPLRFFTIEALEQALGAALPATATAIWKLALRQSPIDVDALRRLMVTRYGWASDDVEHVDHFGPIQ
jgi:hypothetical protein